MYLMSVTIVDSLGNAVWPPKCVSVSEKNNHFTLPYTNIHRIFIYNVNGNSGFAIADRVKFMSKSG